ncbi:MAG: hypothetical protein QOC98_3114 [Frankiaceae bacterium]|nr:hypothetical protein [Frankiaceae bacterium]
MPVSTPTEVRQVTTPAALALADLAGIFEDLQTVLRCCERLMAVLAVPRDADELSLEAFWTTAVLSYGRCFDPSERGQLLTADDVTATGLPGDVAGWHETLAQVRKHYTEPSLNPREVFSVGVARDDSGAAAGVAVTSTRHPLVDEVSVRQTGAIAFELSRIVDTRISEQQQVVFTGTSSLSGEELDALPLLDLVDLDDPGPNREPPPAE